MNQILSVQEKYSLKICFHDFDQAVFAQYQKQTLIASKNAYVAFNNDTGVTATAELRGESVKAAIQLEIISGIETSHIGTLKPYVVNWLADELRKHVTAVTTEPADPNS